MMSWRKLDNESDIYDPKGGIPCVRVDYLDSGWQIAYITRSGGGIVYEEMPKHITDKEEAKAYALTIWRMS